MRSKKTRRYVLGIDLGTTNTLCSVWYEGDPEPKIVPIKQPTNNLELLEACSPLPSVVMLKNGMAYVGEYAKSEARFNPAHIVKSIKREMGTPWIKLHGGRTWTPDQISGCILRAVHQGIEIDSDLPEPERVVITVPACFGVEQRRATLRAARLAGFKLETTELFDEPTAALLHDTWHRQSKQVWASEQRLMVLDIGGGTLDVSCMSLLSKDGVLHADVLGRSRFNELAGDDFDLNLAGLLLARYEREKNLSLKQIPEEPCRQLCHGLVAAAEAAKIDLSQQARGIPVESQGNLTSRVEVMDHDAKYRWKTLLKMPDLGEALKPFFYRDSTLEGRIAGYSFYTATEECMESLRTAKIPDPDRLPDMVFLAGGSADLPFIKQVVTRHFEALPKPRKLVPEMVDRPMEAVSLGAAWYAGSRAGFASSGAVELTQRMHEGIYLLTGSGVLEELVNPAAVLPVVDREIPREFVAGTSDRLEVDLVAGTGAEDVRMRPLGRQIVKLSGFVKPDSVIRLRITVDHNRDCTLTCESTVDGKTVSGEMMFHNGYDWQKVSEVGKPLPVVNPPSKGGAS